MIRRFFHLMFVVAALAAAATAFGQTADQSTPGAEPEEERKHRGFREKLEKLRIEQEKKDHDKMMARGEEAVRLSADLQRTIDANGSLSEKDLAKVAQVERIVKKIRDELGGNGDGDVDDPTEVGTEEPVPQTQKGMVASLKSKADSMFEQLKNTTRFTISASAIVATNAVLKIARFLKLKN